MLSRQALTALVFLVAALLSVVIVVGLVQKTLDATGVAVALSSVITGVVGGALLRGRSGGDEE